MIKLNEYLDEVFKKASSHTRNEGQVIYKQKGISNLKSKRIEEIYHIYGRAFEKNNIYNCHIKLHFNPKKTIEATCTCDEYIQFSKLKKDYVCKHIVATNYEFYYAIKSKLNRKAIKEPVERKKLKLDIELGTEIINYKEWFTIKLKIGENALFQIQNINEFLKARQSKNRFIINNNLMYDGYNHTFRSEDNIILDYIFMYMRQRKNELNESINKIYIDSYNIKEFLNKIPKEKSIKFINKHIPYNSYIKREMLNWGINLRLDGDVLSIGSKKKMPIALTEENNVFFYYRDIYILDEHKLKNFLSIYNEIKEKGVINYNNPEEKIVGLLKEILSFTYDIALNEGAKNLLYKNLQHEIFIGRDKGIIYCIFKLNYIDKLVNILVNDYEKSIVRDKKREEIIMIKLESLGFIKKEDRFIFIGNEEEEFDLINIKMKKLKELGNVNIYNSFYERKIVRGSDLEFHITYDDGYYFNNNSKEIENNEWKEIYKLSNENRKYYKTKSNNYLDLKDEKVINILNVMELLDLYESDNFEKFKIGNDKLLYLDSVIKKNEKLLDGTILNSYDDIKNIIGLEATLRPYQLKGVNFLNNLSEMKLGGILADEMGLGKTIQVISFLLTLKNKKSIIITPTSLIYNWKSEFEKFAPSLKIGIIHGSSKNRQNIMKNFREFDVVLTTYGTLKNDIEIHKNNIYDYCIIDEAQNIKNSKAQVTKTIKTINSNIRFALTGTPIENNLLELWSIFDFILPGYLKDESMFKNRYMNGDKEKIQELKLLINSFILRRLKSEVINELPDKNEKIEIVSMKKEQREIYNSYIKEVREKLKVDSDRITIFSYLIKLRLLAIDPSVVITTYSKGSGKLDKAKEIINKIVIENEKVLVFSQFTTVLKKFKIQLEEDGIKAMYLDGTINAKDRINLVEKFNNEDIPVFLISLKAGGTGLNLTAANTVIHLDPWWNPAVENQATDRAHRIGQKNIVQVIKLISKDSIEEKIIKLQEEKKEVINEILNDGKENNELIRKMSNEELFELFK